MSFLTGTCIFLVLSVTLLQVQAQISDSVNAFGIELLANTAALAEKSANLALSPFTVWTLLSVVDEGARDNTARELESVLRIPRDKTEFRKQFNDLSNSLKTQDEGINLDISTSIFATWDQKLKPSFRDVTRKYYGIDVRPIDFSNKQEASRNINDYVAKATRNRIQDLIKPDDLQDTQIFMASTLYFKGEWNTPFNRSATKREAFYDENLNKIGEVDMMYQMGFFPYARIDFLRAYAVELPYGHNERMSMILILPFRGETLQNTLNGLMKSSFKKIIDTLNTAKDEYADEDVIVYIPRFSVQSDYVLNVVLDKMGLKDVFNDQKANLLGMFPHFLALTKLVQKAEIEVNEEGTVASAASGAAFAYKSPPPKFLANKPFLYFIVDKPTSAVVFAGKISSPPSK